MNDVLERLHTARQRASDVMFDKVQIRTFRQACYPLGYTPEVVVENCHANRCLATASVVPVQNGLDQVIPKKARSPGDQQAFAGHLSEFGGERACDVGEIRLQHAGSTG